MENIESIENNIEVEVEISCICCGKMINEENFTKFKGMFCSRLCLEEYDELGSYDSIACVG